MYILEFSNLYDAHYVGYVHEDLKCLLKSWECDMHEIMIQIMWESDGEKLNTFPDVEWA